MLDPNKEFCKSDRAGAIVLGGDAMGLGIARALGENAIKVIVFSWEYGIAEFSRYVQRTIKIPPPCRQDAFVKAIRKFIQELELKGWVVYPTDDDSVECMAKFGKDLGLRVWGVNSEQYDLVVDKMSFSDFADSLKLQVPKTILFNRFGKGTTINFPAIIKPRVKEPFFRIVKKKAIRVESSQEAYDCIENLSPEIPREHLLLQEIIPGNGLCQLSYAALTLEGKPLAELTACRRRQHPRDFGRASTFVYTVENNEVREIGRKILSNLSYTGLAEVEFKRHRDTGELYLLELNPRTWGWHTLVRAAHCNWLAGLHSILCQEKPVLQEVKTTHASWVKIITDLPTAFFELWDGETTLGHLIKDYCRRPMAFSTWDKRDLMPFVAEWILLPYLAVKRGY